MSLPVAEALPRLTAALEAHRNAVLQAPPGAGKSTGVPPALLDAPWLEGRRIVMLEPRRLAARAVATRMASVDGERVGATFGYRTRLDSQVSRDTRVEVVTEGILTRRLQNDPGLEGVALVIFDEFHERNLEGDLALALCLDAQGTLRGDLRILVMSATLDGAAVSGLLGNAPVVTSEGRSFDVETRYPPRSNRGEERIEAAVVRAVRTAHASEPGDMLVFLPGAGEIRRVAQLLEESPLDARTRVLPLYGDLPPDMQDAALRPAGTGERKIVLATNIAETSLTIDGVRIVIDSGLERRNRFDPASGMSRLETLRISRASADQRRGRAGRLAPGVCIRLWSEGEQSSLAAQSTAEILEADLAPLALELAEWGVTDPSKLRWLDPPPAAPFAQARDLLVRLHALDRTGRITAEGRAMAALGTHPRLAHLMVRAQAMKLAPLAAEIAGVLSERDLLRPRARERNVDLELRIEALRTGRSPAADQEVDSGARQRAARQRDLFLRRLDLRAPATPQDVSNAGELLAFAYPDRIAQKRDQEGRFLLANGRGAVLADPQSLGRASMLVVAALDAGDREARIHLAARIDPQEFERLYADEIETREEIEWSSREQAVVAREIRVFGALTLAERPLKSPSAEQAAAALVIGIRELGFDALPWTRELRAWRARIELLRRALPERAAEWPAFDDAALAADLESWLAPYLEGVTRRDHFARIDLAAALHARLTWRQREDLDRLMPSHFTVPSGSRIAIEYDAADSPSLSVRLQELFGLKETPAVADGRLPVTLKMLSPAGRPVQVTRDLGSFWARGYHEVRKELKGRYPKHYWPEDPLQAVATRRVRPRH